MTRMIWTTRDLEVLVVGVTKGHLNEDRVQVCKATCPNPRQGLFSVRAEELKPV